MESLSLVKKGQSKPGRWLCHLVRGGMCAFAEPGYTREMLYSCWFIPPVVCIVQKSGGFGFLQLAVGGQQMLHRWQVGKVFAIDGFKTVKAALAQYRSQSFV